ncbi:MAG: hypothetical protein LKF88_01145 [Microbacteriaceae bacterium]|jgi:hypothetical protein|nr:hypothetical protein [Microbacteriaceae bacterium]MCI1206987.1 hypothetical protein [Microbacteriaceae bacterium]
MTEHAPDRTQKLPTTPSSPRRYTVEECLQDLRIVAGNPDAHEVGALAAALTLGVQRRQREAATRIWQDAVPLWRFRPSTRRGLSEPQ